MRINLLPHREERRIALRQRFKMLSILVGTITIATLLFIYLYFMNLSDSQLGRNETLRQSNFLMDNKISKIKSLKNQIAYLIEQQDLIEKLKTDRYNGIILLKELAMALPDGVYLTKFTQKSILRFTTTGRYEDLVPVTPSDAKFKVGDTRSIPRGNQTITEVYGADGIWRDYASSPKWEPAKPEKPSPWEPRPPTPAPSAFSVNDPSGGVHYFKSKSAANAFKKELGNN